MVAGGGTTARCLRASYAAISLRTEFPDARDSVVTRVDLDDGIPVLVDGAGEGSRAGR
jgi:hypothetical protein